MQEQERRQRELREKLAQAKISNVQGLQDPDAIFGPVPDFVDRRRPITRMFFSVYDNLGSLIAINVFTFVCTLPLLFALWMINTALTHHHSVAFVAPALVLGLVAPPAWAAASSFCSKVVEEQQHAVGEFWSDYRRFLGRSIVLAVGQWFVGIMLIYATFWYLGQHAVALTIVGVISLYIFILWSLAGLYVWPLMVRGYRWRAILRNAGVLVMAAPVRSTLMLIVLMICTVLLAFTGVGAVLLLFALWAMLPNQALVLTRERLERRAAERAGA